MAVRAVLVDFYGTLARATTWGPSHQEVFAGHGLELPDEVHHRWSSQVIDGLEHVEHSRSRDHYVAWERARLADLVRACGVGEDDAERLVADLHGAAKTWTMEAFPDVPGALAELRARGLAVVVCSNWDWDLDRAIEAAGLASRVDAVVTSARAGARKPHPRIFRHALDAAGARPDQAVFVGDTWGPDVEGPLAAGLRAVHVWRDGGGAGVEPVDLPSLPPGAARVAHLGELAEVLDGWARLD